MDGYGSYPHPRRGSGGSRSDGRKKFKPRRIIKLPGFIVFIVFLSLDVSTSAASSAQPCRGAMTDESSNGSQPDAKLSPQVDVNPAKVYETSPRSSASSTDDLVAQPSRTATSVSTLVDIYDGEAVDPTYQAKSHAISCAIQQMGMGRYQVRKLYQVRGSRVVPLKETGPCLQWWLFVVAGFGWFRCAFRGVFSALTHVAPAITAIACGPYVQVGPHHTTPI